MAQTMLDQMNFSLMEGQSMSPQEQKNMETLLNTSTKEKIESQQDINFSQYDNVVPKKKEKEGL